MSRSLLLFLSVNALAVVVCACTTPQRALTDGLSPRPLLTCAPENSVPLEATELSRSPRRYSGRCITVRGYEIKGVFFEDRAALERFRRTGVATIGSYGSQTISYDVDSPDHVEVTALAMCEEYSRRQEAAVRREQAILDAEPRPHDVREIPAVLLVTDDSFCAYRNDRFPSLFVFHRRALSD